MADQADAQGLAESIYGVDDESIAWLRDRGVSAHAFRTLMNYPAYMKGRRIWDPRFLMQAGFDDLMRWGPIGDGFGGRPRPIPSAADLRALARAETAFLIVAKDEVVDVESWGEAIRDIRMLTLSNEHGSGRFGNAHRLRDLDAVEWLWVESGLDAPVDLSGLPALREAHVSDPHGVSLLRNPGVELLRVLFDRWPKGLEITQRLTELSIETRIASARPPRIHQPEALVRLALGKFTTVDLNVLAGATRLETLELDCRRVEGLDALARLPRLRSLTVSGARQVDNPDAILGLGLRELRIDRNHQFDDEFVARAAAIPGIDLHVEPLIVARSSDPHFPLSVIDVHEDGEDPLRSLGFTQWGWLETRYEHIADRGVHFNGYVIEEAARIILVTDAPDLVEPDDFDFDSESDGMYVRAANAQVLERLIEVLVPVFNDRRRFGSLLTKAATRVDE